MWLEEAYRRTRKDGAAGVDGVTAQEYEATLTANLTDLLDRFKSCRYRAPPVRRVHLPEEGTNKTRPIGIPTLEDKVLQRAVLMVLESVYEQDFLDCSYGFRPGRSAHQALDALWQGLRAQRGRWVVRRKAAKSRFTRTLRRFNEWSRRNRHLPVAEQRTMLNQKLRDITPTLESRVTPRR